MISIATVKAPTMAAEVVAIAMTVAQGGVVHAQRRYVPSIVLGISALSIVRVARQLRAACAVEDPRETALCECWVGSRATQKQLPRERIPCGGGGDGQRDLDSAVVAA